MHIIIYLSGFIKGMSLGKSPKSLFVAPIPNFSLEYNLK